MAIKTPILDTRTSEDVYKQALKLAKHYCPKWAAGWRSDHFNSDDPGLVVFKVFSNMAGHLITQFNRIPEKHYIAFLDFMGIDHLPVRPSTVPLTFYLADGASRAQVPSGTMVASSKDPDIVFETMHHLSVVPVKLHAFSINPLEDCYTDHSNVISGARIFSIFAKDKQEKPIDHILYIGDDDIFDWKTPFENLRIKFQGSDLSAEYFEQWHNAGPLDVQIIPGQNSKNSLIFDIKNIHKFERSLLNGIQSFWLSTRPDEKKRIIAESGLPSISNITVDIISGSILPESIFFNDAPLDIKKGFYPFGESPKERDVLYISSNEALSKESSTIALNIELEKELENKAVELSWEFWDGASWKALSIIQDGTNSFTKSGICMVEFICPAVAKSDINGQSSRWIRVKIKSGGYGGPGKYEQNPLQYIPPSYNPPFIKSIHFVYSYTNRKVAHILAYNNFSYKHFNSADNIIPFEPFRNKLPAFYLGFEEIAASTQISLYFSVKEKLYIEKSTFKWKYYDGSAWKELSVENDETDSFKKSGIVSFLFPPDIKKNFEFGKELFWIQVEPEYKNQLSCPELEGILPNTVWASNYVTVNNEVLGSGNGMPTQSFSFSRKPVLSGQIIEVKEGEKWVKWIETSSFALSGKLSMDYVLDRTSGKIFFGDGINGMVPSKGKNNIRAAFYRSGGGKRGNQEIGIINTLRRANPEIERVTNHVPSSGGADEEDSECAVFRGPYTIKNRGSAVTAEDFEWLAREASQKVMRAKCLLDDKNKINVIILPDRKDEAPLPENSLMDTVEKYLKERALFTIREKIHISGPDYKRIDSEIKVKPLLLSESSIVSERIKTRLRTFLDPVRGGQYGMGYDFGQEIYLSEVAAAIEDIEGVDYVEEVILKKIIMDNVVEEASSGGWISIENNALPCAGNIEVKIGK